jgi:hypothetical protein
VWAASRAAGNSADPVGEDLRFLREAAIEKDRRLEARLLRQDPAAHGGAPTRPQRRQFVVPDVGRGLRALRESPWAVSLDDVTKSDEARDDPNPEWGTVNREP